MRETNQVEDKTILSTETYYEKIKAGADWPWLLEGEGLVLSCS